MGSGKLNKNNDLCLKSDSFNILDLVKLINIIKIKYDINCTLITKKNSSLIGISNKEIKRLFSILDPYFYDFYKIDKTFIRLAPTSTKNKIKGVCHSSPKGEKDELPLHYSINRLKHKFYNDVLNKGHYGTRIGINKSISLESRSRKWYSTIKGNSVNSHNSAFNHVEDRINECEVIEGEKNVLAKPSNTEYLSCGFGKTYSDFDYSVHNDECLKKIKNVLNISKIQNNIIWEHYANDSMVFYLDALSFLKKIKKYEAYGGAQ